jgi:hypothetical protein
MNFPTPGRIVTCLSLLLLASFGLVPVASSRQAPEPGLRSAGGPPRVTVPSEKTQEPESPGVPQPAVFLLDDGGYEVALGYNNGNPDAGIPPTLNWQIVYVNRFTPDPQDYPIKIDKLSILFPATDSNLRSGLPFEVLVYVGPSDTPDGFGTTLVARKPISILPSDSMFQEIALDNPITVESGDVWVGFTNTYTSSNPEDIIYPAAMDQNSGSEHRSWFFVNDASHGIHFDGGSSLGDADFGAVVDNGSRFAGNWLIRASGQSSATTVELNWAPPDPNAGENPPPRFLQAETVDDSEGVAPQAAPSASATAAPEQQNAVTAYKVYRSNQSPVTPSPNNIFATVPPNQTSARSSAASSGSFFIVTACYADGSESSPSNEASGGIPGPSIIGVPKITPEKIAAKGTGWDFPVTVFFDNVGFQAATTVKNKPSFIKVIQKGRLENGQTIKRYLNSHGEVLLTFRNNNGATTSFRLTVN